MNQTEISKILLVNKSTVCREFKRNIPLRGRGAKVYVAENAQKKTDLRHLEKYKMVTFSNGMKKDARRMMTVNKYSPELIAAQWAKDGKAGVSHKLFINGYGHASMGTGVKIPVTRSCTCT